LVLLAVLVLGAVGGALLWSSSRSGLPARTWLGSLSSQDDAETPGPNQSGNPAGSSSRAEAEVPSTSPGAAPETQAQGDAGRPAGLGVQLAVVSSPPEKTLSAIALPEGVSSATYRIAFEPFGWGPGGAEGGRLVIRITDGESSESGLPDLSERNAIVEAGPDVTEVTTVGGGYTGLLLVRPDGEGRGVFYLEGVKPAQ
jgi:hypothetical protein